MGYTSGYDYDLSKQTNIELLLERSPSVLDKIILPNGCRPIQYCRLRIHNTGPTSLKTVEVMITDL